MCTIAKCYPVIMDLGDASVDNTYYYVWRIAIYLLGLVNQLMYNVAGFHVVRCVYLKRGVN